MSITIGEALELESLKSFKVVAGKRGLDNEIIKVGILDHESDEQIRNDFSSGEFVITNLLQMKDNINDLYRSIEAMIYVGISGLAIKDIYFSTIPDEVIELANKAAFPIMMFSGTFIEDVITSVMNAIKERNESNVLSLKIDNILYNNLDSVIIKKIAYEINGNFKEQNIVAFCRRKDGVKAFLPNSFSSIHENKPSTKIVPYKEGIIFINTFDNIDQNKAAETIIKRLEILGVSSDKYIIGISNLYEKLGELNFSINESMYAIKCCKIYNKEFMQFNQIGVNKILLPIIDNPWIYKYHDEILEPIIVHDNKYKTELLKTAIIYIENNGDIKRTAAELFQHTNTIRYRIEKIGEILNKRCNCTHFYEELAIAIRIYNIINTPL